MYELITLFFVVLLFIRNFPKKRKDRDINVLLDSITGVLPEMTDEEVKEECANYIEEKYFALG